MGIPTVDETTKNAFCQEKVASKIPFMVNDFGLEKRNNLVRIPLVSDSTPGKDYVHLSCIADQQKFHPASATLIDLYLKKARLKYEPAL
jgi:hypothetical protein